MASCACLSLYFLIDAGVTMLYLGMCVLRRFILCVRLCLHSQRRGY
jgi:hypothetical protein